MFLPNAGIAVSHYQAVLVYLRFRLRMRRTLTHDNCTLLVAQVSYPPQMMRGKMPRLRGQGNRM